MGKKKGPNCHHCQYFYVSWDKKFPNGCKYLNIKGKHLPSMEVLSATGKHCCWFQPKPGCAAACQAEPEVEVILPPGCSMSITA